jgi:hypothetical protein
LFGISGADQSAGRKRKTFYRANPHLPTRSALPRCTNVIRQVTQQNAGRNAPGIDGVVCKTPDERVELLLHGDKEAEA